MKAVLSGVFEHLHLYVINSKSDEVLDYTRYEKEGIGLTAVAVGGLSLAGLMCEHGVQRGVEGVEVPVIERMKTAGFIRELNGDAFTEMAIDGVDHELLKETIHLL